MFVNELQGQIVVALLTAAVAPLAVIGCAEDGTATARWTGTMRDSAGITIVENHDTPVWREGEGWHFTRVLKIGVAEGELAYMIGSLTGLVMLSDGRVVIGDGQNHNVRFFSPDGTYLATVGKAGEGPGEFSGGINLLLGPGDTILAIDGRTQRANVISPDAEWLSSFSTLPRDGFYGFSWDDDETTREIVSLQGPIFGEGRPPDARFSFVVLRNLQGAFLDTLARLPASQTVTGEGNARLVHLYLGGPDYDLCDGMVVTGHSDDYRLTWRRRDGTVVRIASLDREPLAITDEDQRVLFDRIDVVAQQNQAPQAAVAESKSRIRFEPTYPAFRRFVCGPEGSILVQRIQPLREMTPEQLENFGVGATAPGADEWDVFDREGRYLGVAPLPTPPHRHAFTRDRSGAWLMVGIERDELDVPYAGVWRVEGLAMRR